MSSPNFPGYLGGGLSVAVNTSSSTPAVIADTPAKSAGDDCLVDNRGAVDAFINLGGATVVATALCVRVPAGQGVIFAKGSATHIAAITASGSTTLVVHVGQGV